MRKLIGAFGLATAAVVLSACGGGGGSAGDTQERYSISLRADKLSLPTNIAGARPYVNGYAGTGVSAPYTTTLYVQALEGSDPIPGTEEAFTCDLKAGLDTGSLMYLDGDEEHYEEVELPDGTQVRVENAYRNIVLHSNAGGNTFHFHAGDQAGVATITCSVMDPRDSRVYSDSVQINVGGGAGSGKVASIQTRADSPVLGVQGNLYNLRTSTVIHAFLWDDANQPVPYSGHPNLQVSIPSASDAAAGARLLSGSQSGSVLQVDTVGGVGQFALSSGSREGSILLEMTADRFDNDVTNGIQDPVTGYLVVNASNDDPFAELAEPIEFVDITPPSATNWLPYSYALSATGGTPPYAWTALGGLPQGMTLSTSGLLSGTPRLDTPGNVEVAVRVVDSRGASATANFTLAVNQTPTNDPEADPLFINLSGCGSDVNALCDLPGAPVGDFYQYVVTATGAGLGPVTWELIDPPGMDDKLDWLKITDTGILHGWVPVSCGQIGEPFFIQAKKGTATTMRKVRIRGISGSAGTC